MPSYFYSTWHPIRYLDPDQPGPTKLNRIEYIFPAFFSYPVVDIFPDANPINRDPQSLFAVSYGNYRGEWLIL